MTTTITATAKPYSLTYPTAYAEIAMTGINTPTVVSVSVTAVYTDTYYTEQVVRGVDFVPPGGSSLTVNDHEVAPGLSVAYRLDTYDTTGAYIASYTSNTILLDPSDDTFSGGYYYGAYLKSTSQPGLSQKLMINDFDTVGIEGKTLGEYDIIGSSLPVVVTDSLGGRKGSFVTYGHSSLSLDDTMAPSWQSIDLLLKSSGKLLFLSYYPYQTGIDPMYMKVDSVSKKRVTVAVPDSTDERLFIEYTINFT